MHRLLPLGLLLALSLGMVIPLASQSRTDSTLTRLAQDFTVAFNAKDSAKVGTFYAEDATLMPPNEAAVRGRQNIEGWFKGGIDAGFSDFQLTPTESAVAGRQAFEAGTYSIVVKPGTPAVTDKGKYVVIYKRVGGDWKIAYDIFNSDLPPESPAKK